MIKLDFKKIMVYFIYRNDRFATIRLWRDWRALVLVFSVLLIAVLFVNGYLFWKYKFGSFVVGSEVQTAGDERALILKKQSLERAVSDLEKKEKAFSEYLSSTSTPLIKDPSI
jgi:hypothetical protein